MIPHIKGITTKQAHVDIPDGLCEEEVGRNGFKGKYTHFYRTEAPVDWIKMEGNIKPRSFDPLKIEEKGDFILSRKRMLYNDDCSVYFLNFKNTPNYYFRNADGDELYFVHEGAGLLESDYGPLPYVKGDYLLIPRGTSYKFNPDTLNKLLLVESPSEIDFPDKAMLGQHALFDPAVIKTPEPMVDMSKKGEFEVKIKRLGEYSTVTYPFCPLNAVGWKGTLCVQQLNVKDIRPISCDRYHLPPSAHSTFVAHNFVICSFLPRPLENGDPGALKVPFYHSNIDFDEVLFYHAGEFFSRSGIDEGMMTFHPQGIQHGPHKGAIERTKDTKETQEIAVMIDTRRPLLVDTTMTKIEDQDYWKSWMED